MGRISVTERESAERCGWRHDFGSKNRMNLEAATPDSALGLGTLVHKTLDSLAQYQAMEPKHAYVNGHLTLKDKCLVCNRDIYAHFADAYDLHAGKMHKDYIDHYTNIVGMAPPQDEQKKVRTIMSTGRIMIDNFLEQRPILPPGYKFLEPEQRIIKQLPGTEHCTCYYNEECACERSGSCRYLHSYYVDCKCSGSSCTCRALHDCEGTLDVLCQHIESGVLAISDYKTFTVHTAEDTLKRLPQFMGYTWLGWDIGVRKFLYSGLWVRTEIPGGKTWDDMFPRYEFTYKPAQLESWAEQTAITALRVFDPKYVPVRTVHPVGGCKGVNNCYYTRVCDARFEQSPNYPVMLRTEYKLRERDDDYI